jgi:CheY-like chemotaxis protein/predicted Ser/Thr protein kinase
MAPAPRAAGRFGPAAPSGLCLAAIREDGKFDRFRQRFFEGAPRYRWLGTLGHGGVGTVFKALDTELDEVVAIKVLSPNIERDEQALLARFKREIQLNRKIKHPNVARMYDYGVSGDYPYITMEYVDGKDLWDLVEERKRIPPAEAVPILRQIVRGTGAIHRLGILHRDLKSQNVIVDAAGAVAILDFGLARGEYDQSLTLASMLLGTPQYMSPEQALGEELDVRSDIYSIGIIAFEMLTGAVPFWADSPVAIAMKHVTDPIPDRLDRFPDVSPALKAIVLRSLEKAKENRFASTDDLETELALLEQAPRQQRDSAVLRVSGEDEIIAALENAFNSIVLPKPAAPVEVRAAGGAVSPTVPVVPIVLVVQDDVPELLKTATAVCSVGCRTLEARNGQEALEALLKSTVHLVLMDVDLPRIDGFDVTRIVKSQPALASLPVLLTTGRFDRGQLAFAVQSGATDLLQRPFAAGTLGPRLWQILRHQGFVPPREFQQEVKTAPAMEPPRRPGPRREH